MKNICNLNDMSIIIQIITNIFVIVGGLVAISQYLLSIKTNKKAIEKDIEIHEKEIYQRDREKIVKAIELAKYYKDEILPLMRKLKKIYIELGIYDLMQSIDKNLMVNFDIVEIEKILTKPQIEQIKALSASYPIATVLPLSNIVYNVEYIQEEKSIDETNIEHINKNDDYAELIINVLNSLEYFSMHFVHNTADHTVTYQPLHTTFLEVIRMLYYNIASVNIKGEQKFFVNTIALFKKWNKISIEQEDKENNAMRSAADIGKILKDNENISLNEY